MNPFNRFLLSSSILILPLMAAAADDLATGWNAPPQDAKLRAYWWWLNSNVTTESITRDLEEMKAKGFGGALICDAGGATQDGNATVPAGPVFLSPEWRKLYRHSLNEAARLGLEMSLNIQSGWNLGGPCVKPEDAAKKLVWTEANVAAGSGGAVKLANPAVRDGFYQDLFVVAYPLAQSTGPEAMVATSSNQDESHSASMAADGNPATFWVSNGSKPNDGPKAGRAEWLELRFEKPFPATQLTVVGREGYGPRQCVVMISDDGKNYRKVAEGNELAPDQPSAFKLSGTPARYFRIDISASHDPNHPQQPRNVQISEVRIDGGGKSLRAAERMAHELGGLKSAWLKTRCQSILGGSFC